jgi:hypothetical protein
MICCPEALDVRSSDLTPEYEIQVRTTAKMSDMSAVPTGEARVFSVRLRQDRDDQGKSSLKA